MSIAAKIHRTATIHLGALDFICFLVRRWAQKKERRRELPDSVNSRRRPWSKLLDAQVIQIRHVVVQDEVLLVLSHSGGLLEQNFLRPWPVRGAMREIVGPV